MLRKHLTSLLKIENLGRKSYWELKKFKSLNMKFINFFSENDGFKKFKKKAKEVKTKEQEPKQTFEEKKNEQEKQEEDQKEKKKEEEAPKEDKQETKPEDKNKKFWSEIKKPSLEQLRDNASKNMENYEKAVKDFFKNGYTFGKSFGKKYKFTPHHLLLLILTSIIAGKFIYDWNNPQNIIDFKEFYSILNSNECTKIIVTKVIKQDLAYSFATIKCIHSEDKILYIGNVDHFLERLEKYQLEKGIRPGNFFPVEFSFNDAKSKPIHRFERVLHLVVSLLLFYMMFKSPNNASKVTKLKTFEKDANVAVKFNDVAGLDEAKREIVEFVDFLKHPKKYQEMGARIPKGALLSGPPGTGKTMLAKACAGEAGVPFFYMSGSDFVEMFVGLGATRVRDLFKQAKESSPSIIFIDEIDAVGKKREAKFGGHEERDNTLNQLLVEMDGFGTDSNVIVLAATNKREVLDTALTRPGRFDRSIDVNLPDIEGRREIFIVHLKKLKLHPSKTIEEYAKRLSTLSPGFSGADIANLCNEAAILAARKNRDFVESIDFELSSERMLAGLERKKIITEEEKKVIAYHEAGHAVVSWFLKGGNPLLKLTIIPRTKGHLGFSQYLPSETHLETQSELMDRLSCILGGRCSEELFFGNFTTGAADDIQKAAEVAYAIIAKLGMSEKLGYLGIPDFEYVRKHSEKTQNIIDEEIKLLINKATERSREIVKKHKSDIENLATALIEKETLDLKAITEILGERPFPLKQNLRAYLETKISEELPQSSQK